MSEIIGPDEATLIRKRDRYEFLAKVFAWVIVIGLLVEGYFALRDKMFWPDAVKELVSTFLISAGVAGEIIFAGRSGKYAETLRSISEIKVAEANARALEAQLELARLRERRSISELQNASIASKLEAFSGQEVMVIASPSTYEAIVFAEQIHRTLASASLNSHFLERWLVTGPNVIAEDISVVFLSGDTHGQALASAITDALTGEGIKAELSPAKPDWWDVMSKKALVVVGTKT